MLLRRLWSLLTSIGPAPAGGKGSGAAPTLEEGARGPFDDPDGGDGGEAEPAADDRDEGDGEADPEGRQDDEPPAGDNDDEAGDDDSGDEDDDSADADADADAEDEDEDEDEDDDAGMALRSSWEARLATASATRGDERPRIPLNGVRLGDEARKRFDEARKAEDGEKDADAIFEIAMDAVLQTLGVYHDNVAKPKHETAEKSIRNVQVGSRLNTFRKAVGDSLTPKIERKMAEVYQEFAAKHGWREADAVPLTDLFRMAGGRMPKKGKKPAAQKPEDKAARAKAAALGAARGPRALGGGNHPNARGGKPKDPEERALASFRETVRDSSDFFTL